MNKLLEGCNTSAKIKALIASRNHTQNDLAKLLEIVPSAIVARITDNRWDVKELEKIADAYGVNKQDLI
jgi:DNA-binding XRE family transcriptional regulator